MTDERAPGDSAGLDIRGFQVARSLFRWGFDARLAWNDGLDGAAGAAIQE